MNASTPLTLIAAAIALLGSFVGDAQAQSAIEAQAQRQLTFARAELESGDFDRAAKSAGSAMRLSPGLLDAMVVKALAYEGAGDVRRAEALVITYIDIVGVELASPEAIAAEGRLEARRGSRSRGAIRAQVAQRTADQVVVVFESALKTEQAPRVFWRKPQGEWRSAPMLRASAGWTARVQLSGASTGELAYRVEAADGAGGEGVLLLDGRVASR